MTIPDHQTLMLPVLRLAAEGEKRVVEVEGQIADELPWTTDCYTINHDVLRPRGQ